ncbi:MAG: phosphoribosylformylglycinamidine cyclo-ligase [Cyanobacteriota bacterium]|nr:phosphoribosylformylglycinamidine cyclo-ligase [Cyanobacteriota bacterium]
MDYKQAGVDVEAGREFVEKIREMVQSTNRPGVLGQLGGFGGLFALPSGYKEPVLVSGTDGVGTKLKLATALNRHDTVGMDLVGMCANDVLTSGAEPLFFLDYLATGKLEPEQLAGVVAGIASGCKQAGCALVGGETAEMPGFYPPGEYDMAGFCVGIVEKSEILDGNKVRAGDVAIALASSGVHSNGFSLVRKIIGDRQFNLEDCPEELGTQSLGDALLTPTRIYVKEILAARQTGLDIHAMAHITGGGVPENLPRCLPEGMAIDVDRQSWDIPPLFRWIARAGDVKEEAMFNTFNMGIGFVLLVPPEQEKKAIEWFESQKIPAYNIGKVTGK